MNLTPLQPQWLSLCALIRRFPPTSDVFDTARVADFFLRILTPALRRPLSVYSPVLASAWRTALGMADDDVGWYKVVHPVWDFALPRVVFSEWQRCPEVRRAIADNLDWCNSLLDAAAATAIGDNHFVARVRMAQAAYDFDLPRHFDSIVNAVETSAASAHQNALFQLIW